MRKKVQAVQKDDTDDAVDYVIIGAGSAGAALAEGLSRSGRMRVALLEAGGDDRRFWINTPLGYGRLFNNPAVNWCYETEPDAGLNGRRDFWPRGRVLGGSSAVNAMVFIRGQAADFEDWKAAGCPGWGYDDVLPVFKAMETNQAGADAWRGGEGPVHVADVSARLHPLAERFIRAGESAGFARNRDFNGAAQEGFGAYQFTIGPDARRVSAARAFLRPAAGRENLRVLTGALAARVVFEGRRAAGVEYIRRGARHTVRARAGVVLCAGVVETPVLLMRSGIGPGPVLQNLGVAPVFANPNVGRHLQDHMGANYYYRSRIRTLNSRLRSWPAKALAGAEYLLARRGPLALSLNQAGGFVRSSPARERPNIQLYLQALTATQTPQSGNERPLLRPDPFEAFALGTSSCRPKSRGEILAASPDPAAQPLIKPNAFSHPDDMAELIEAARVIFRLANAPPLAEVSAGPLDAGLDAGASDAVLEDDLRARAATVYHPCGTCRMGPDAETSVVDPHLRVHGAEALYAADASVLPHVLAGNLNAVSMMIGLRAVKMITAGLGTGTGPGA
ncbi:MAG: GMC family oxidoreductase [Rhodospirillales bacterium]